MWNLEEERLEKQAHPLAAPAEQPAAELSEDLPEETKLAGEAPQAVARAAVVAVEE